MGAVAVLSVFGGVYGKPNNQEGKRMNWQKEAINDLRQYCSRKQSLENLAERKRAFEEKYKAIRCSMCDTDPVMGGSSRIEDNMINNIVERQRIDMNIEATKKLVDITERGLSGLDDKQRKVLNEFYINRSQNHVERLMDILGYEKTAIYDLKDQALYDFTIAMFGLTDY